MTKRYTPQKRRDEILKIAVDLAVIYGLQSLTRDQIAENARVTGALITHYFYSMPLFRREIMQYAITNRILPVVAQGLLVRNSLVMAAPVELRKEAIQHMASVGGR